jgi:putative aminopeptidase FrvX
LSEHNKLQNLILKLVGAAGVSGAESGASKVAAEELSRFMNVNTDTLGNVVGTVGETGPVILLDAHIDQIGMIVTGIDDEGFIKVDKCGGMDIRGLAAQEVIVWGKKPLKGVVASIPPHLSNSDDAKTAKKITDLSIDAGMTAEKAKITIRPGDRVTLSGNAQCLMGDKICSPALDDRVGVAAILRSLELLEGRKIACKLVVQFSVQEETGGSGAKTGSYNSEAEECITVDVSFASAPGIPEEKCGDLGKGPMLGVAPILDESMFKTMEKIAIAENIPYQVEVMGARTGTNADSIQTTKAGIKTALLSIPLRNMHTPTEIISLADVENTARLIAAYILNREGKNE